MCDECPSVFMDKHRLQTHKHHVHKIGSNRKKKELQCKFCDKKYSSDQSLKEHVLRDHEKRTPYQCQHCTRSFGIRMKLKSHIQNVHERVSHVFQWERITKESSNKIHSEIKI